MALDNYTDLQTSIGKWLWRQDLTSLVPDFIAMAEAQMSRRLLKDGPVRMMMGRLPETITAEFMDVPDDFMGVLTAYVDGSGTGTCVVPLKIASADEINDLKAYRFNQDGPPRRFAVVGTSFQFWPWNGVSLAAEITYWQRIPALAEAEGGTNWLLTLHPDAYLYGSLLQAAPYLKDDNRVQMWSTIFETILSDITDADKIERTAAQIAIPPTIVA